MATGQVSQYGGIVSRKERLVRAIPAFDRGQFAHATDELVPARRRIACLSGSFAQKSDRENILATTKQRAEERDLLGGCSGRMCVVADFGGRSGSPRCFRILGDRQISAKRFESRPRITRLLDEFSEATLFAGDLVDQLLPRGALCARPVL